MIDMFAFGGFVGFIVSCGLLLWMERNLNRLCKGGLNTKNLRIVHDPRGSQELGACHYHAQARHWGRWHRISVFRTEAEATAWALANISPVKVVWP